MYTLLSLGDSYTIGEGVLLPATYPYQTIQMLRHLGHPFAAPEIIARTGWTTDELADAIGGAKLLPAYDFVSLLIGVNNQYRGRSCEEYGRQFGSLLGQAIGFAGGKAGHVFVLSIPDWSVSPFAADRDRDVITREIDGFNAVAGELCEQHQAAFIDITPHSRGHERTFAADGLHPSEEQYRYWARRLTEKIARQLSPQ
jgi:lysophospholipase L1-like esterase